MASDSLQLHKPISEEEANHLIQERDTNRDGALNKKELMKEKSQSHGHGQKKGGGMIAPKLQLSREQIKEVFREHDIDGDGHLSISELTRAFGFLGSILPFYKAHYGMAHADADADGLISMDELEKLIDYVEKTNRRK